MNREELSDLRALPKAELHRHLEGSIRPSTVFELSVAAGLDLPSDSPEAFAADALITRPVDGLEEALRAFGYAQGSVRTYDAVRRIARESVEDLAGDCVRLAELRFSPHFLCEPGALDWGLAMEAVADGVEEAVAAGADVEVGLVAIFSRNYGLESGRATVRFALDHADRLVGFDVAGPEIGFPPAMYRELLAPLVGSGLGLTVHYGESGPPSYPREAIRVLRPARLGHGLSVAGDPEATALAAGEGVTLEMCPTSNWLTGGVADLRHHPARRLLHEGVRVTLNTDDPGLMGIDLTHELDVARSILGFTDADLARVTDLALEATFVARDRTDEVRSRHFGWVRHPEWADRSP